VGQRTSMGYYAERPVKIGAYVAETEAEITVIIQQISINAQIQR